MMKAMVSKSVQLVIHPHLEVMSAHRRIYNVSNASEVAALIFGDVLGKLDIVLRFHGTLIKKGREKLPLTHLVNRMYDRLAYPLLSLTEPKVGILSSSIRIRNGMN